MACCVVLVLRGVQCAQRACAGAAAAANCVLQRIPLPRAAPLQGLGEMMPEQLWSTTLNPETRTLRKLTIDDAGGGGGHLRRRRGLMRPCVQLLSAACAAL